jgi:hypothetical protein
MLIHILRNIPHARSCDASRNAKRNRNEIDQSKALRKKRNRSLLNSLIIVRPNQPRNRARKLRKWHRCQISDEVFNQSFVVDAADDQGRHNGVDGVAFHLVHETVVENGEPDDLSLGSETNCEGCRGGDEIIWCDDGDDNLIRDEDAAYPNQGQNEWRPSGADIMRIDDR